MVGESCCRGDDSSKGPGLHIVSHSDLTAAASQLLSPPSSVASLHLLSSKDHTPHASFMCQDGHTRTY